MKSITDALGGFLICELNIPQSCRNPLKHRMLNIRFPLDDIHSLLSGF